MIFLYGAMFELADESEKRNLRCKCFCLFVFFFALFLSISDCYSRDTLKGSVILTSEEEELKNDVLISTLL